MGSNASCRQRQRPCRAFAVYRAVRGQHRVDVPRNVGAFRRGGRSLGGSRVEFGAGLRHQHRNMGVARRPAGCRASGGYRLLDCRPARRWPHRLGLVVGGRLMRRPRTLFQIFGWADYHRRRRLSADRAEQPALARATAALSRWPRRSSDLSSRTDLECRTRVGLFPVPGRTGRRAVPPLRTDHDPGRRSWVSAPLDMGPVGGVRRDRSAARTARRGTLVVGLPGRADLDRLHGCRAVGQGAFPLGRPRLFDAAAAARRRDRSALAHQPHSSGLARCNRRVCRCRDDTVGERSKIRLAPRPDRRVSAWQGPNPRCRGLDLVTARSRRSRTPRPAGAGRGGSAMVRCRKNRLCTRWQPSGHLPRPGCPPIRFDCPARRLRRRRRPDRDTRLIRKGGWAVLVSVRTR